MGDIVGRLFREFAMTLSVTILISAVVSLTLTPMMCARLLHHKPESERGRLYHASERMFQAIIAFYGRTLAVVLRHQTITLMVAAGTLVATVWLFLIIPKGFFPVQDTGVILGVSEAPQMISFPAMATRQQAVVKVLLQDPAIESLSSFIGIDGTNTTVNSGRIQINLKPLEERKIGRRRYYPPPAAGAGQGGRNPAVHASRSRTLPSRIASAAPSSNTAWRIRIRKELAEWAPRFIAKLQSLPVLRDVASDQQNGGLRETLVIDRNTASRFGITPQMVDDTL